MRNAYFFNLSRIGYGKRSMQKHNQSITKKQQRRKNGCNDILEMALECLKKDMKKELFSIYGKNDMQC